MSADVIEIGTRRFTVGGSEAAAACGVDPYQSRVMLWARKTGRVPATPDNEAMLWGKLIEPVILDVLDRDHGFSIFNGREVYTDAERPWMVGHPDKFGWHDETDRTFVIDAKTTGPWSAGAWADDDAPTSYIVQLQHYMHLTGLDHGLLACLVAGQRLVLRTVERDQAAIDLMLALEEDFVGLCVRDEWPEPVGSESDSDALRAMFPQGEPGKTVRLDRRGMRLVEEYRIVDRAYQRCKAQRDELKQRLQILMGDAEVAETLGGDVAAKWTTYMRNGAPARRFTVPTAKEAS